MEDFKQGDLVEYYQEPLEGDWNEIGEIDIEFPIGAVMTMEDIDDFHGNKGIKIKDHSGNNWWYPAVCFRKVNEKPNYPIYL